MRRLSLVLTLSMFVAGPSALLADTVPYTNLGTVANYVPLYAATTGNITLTYIKAGDTGFVDHLAFYDVTQGTTSAAFFFNSGLTTVGATQTFSVVQGDLLDFIVYIALPAGIPPVTPQNSIPTLNADGVTHAFVTSFAGGSIAGSSFLFPAGIYVGMEDLPKKDSDFNYNDEAFIINGATTVAPVPEPGTLSLLGTGLLGAAGIARRKFFSR